MKRIHLLFLCLLCCGVATAQSQSLAAALEALNQRQSDYEISFIHNDLEHCLHDLPNTSSRPATWASRLRKCLSS